MAENKNLMMLLSIVQGDMGVKLIKTLTDRNIRINFQFVGHGTAPTEMMDIFGLSTNNKDIVVSIGAEQRIKELMLDFDSVFNNNIRYGGLMIVLDMLAANRMVAELLTHQISNNSVEGEVSMKNEHHNNLIFISVNNGYSDAVMEVAKKVGATGGTVIKGRLADAELFGELGQLKANEEREVICILAPESVSHEIMQTVNENFGFSSEANGIICAVPTEKAYKI